MLFAQLFDNFGAGRRLVANCFSANSFLEFVNHFRRKSVLVNRERLVQPNAGHFPVARRGVFSRRMRRTFSIRPARFFRGS